MSGKFLFMGEQEDPEMDTHAARGMRVYDGTGSGAIPFTQFLLPHGRRRDTYIERPAEIRALAVALLDAGYHFEIETLRDGTVSMDCSRPGDDGPVWMEIAANGPGVADAVDRLVKKSHAIALSAAPKNRSSSDGE